MANRKLKYILSLVITLFVVTFGLCGYYILRQLQYGKSDSLNPTPLIFSASYQVGKVQLSMPETEFNDYTLKWHNNLSRSIPESEIDSLLQQKKPLFIRLEIWPYKNILKRGKTLAERITEGEWDKKLIAFAEILAASSDSVYVTYNEQMEVPFSGDPWKSQSEEKYIRSFRHVRELIRKSAPNVRMVWSPLGYPGVEDYWPGEQAVDLCSVSLMEWEFDDDRYPKYGNLKEMVRRKLFRMRFFDKTLLLFSESDSIANLINKEFITDLNNQIKSDSSIYHCPIEPLDGYSIDRRGSRVEPLTIGVYDPDLKLINQKEITVEHLFTDLLCVDNGYFKESFDSVVARGHDVIVTFEPWKDGKQERDSILLENTINGVYDKTIERLHKIITETDRTVYFRWGHEMEIPVTRYPWQSQDPVTYIKAFRHVASLIRAENVKVVWGPAGDRGSNEWWPGGEFVDLVSMAVYGLPDKDINDFNRQLSFSTIFKSKFHRLRYAHKPFFITEFGVKGPQEYKKKWLEDAALTINQYPDVKGVNYFNFADVPKAWGNAETPDWSINPETFRYFVSLLPNVVQK